MLQVRRKKNQCVVCEGGSETGRFETMNMVEPPPGGPASAAPVAVQQTTYIQVGSQKSVAGAVLLALFFGPLGMIYATVPGALIMFAISFVVAFATLGLGLLITLPICAIWAGVAASSHNKALQGMSTQAAVSGHSAYSPAGWHNDPEGSGRLRYFDGVRWTNHYAHTAAPAQPEEAAAPAPTPQLEAPEPEPEPELEPEPEPEAEAEAEPESEADTDTDADSEAPTVVASAPEQVFCGACGNSISPTARFCSACGETQAVA